MASKIALTFEISEPRTETIEHDIIKIGSGPTNHLRLEAPSVSRMHAVIEVASPTEMTIIDLGSDNGTLVNGERVNKSPLKLGDRVEIGTVVLRVTSTEPVLKEPSGYRDSPLVTQEEREPEIRALAKPSPWALAARWWPAPVSAGLLVVYVAQHGLTLPALETDGLFLDWPVPPLVLFTALLASFLALGDAFLRRSDGQRTPAGRLLLVLAVLVAAPWLIQLGLAGLSIGGTIVGVVTAAGLAIFGIYRLGRWIMRGRE